MASDYDVRNVALQLAVSLANEGEIVMDNDEVIEAAEKFVTFLTPKPAVNAAPRPRRDW